MILPWPEEAIYTSPLAVYLQIIVDPQAFAKIVQKSPKNASPSFPQSS